MLQMAELSAVADHFGAAETQVRRDHLLSHLLAALGTSMPENVRFIGGTALNRGFFPEGRLYEDLDLVAVGHRRDIVEEVSKALTTGARREYPRLRWNPPLADVRDVDAAVLIAEDGTTVRSNYWIRRGCQPGPSNGELSTSGTATHRRLSFSCRPCRRSQLRKRLPGRTDRLRAICSTCG